VSATIAHGPSGDAPAVRQSRWPVLDRSLRDRRRSLTGWALGIGIYVGLIVSFWPSIRGSSEISKAIENYPDAMKEFFGGAAAFDYTRPGGFLNTQLFSLLLPLLIGAFAIGYGASTLAGEQRSGQLDLLLALPMTRARIVREKTMATATSVALLTLVSAVVILGVGALVDLDIAVPYVAAACLGAGLVALLHGLLALTIGAASGNRGLALGLSSAAFAAGYLIQALSGLVDAVKPLRALSPLYHANGTLPINTGFPIWHHLLLAGLCAMLAVVAVRLFEQRDVIS
jgi:ABC-2 type transport system permease protein